MSCTGEPLSSVPQLFFPSHIPVSLSCAERQHSAQRCGGGLQLGAGQLHAASTATVKPSARAMAASASAPVTATTRRMPCTVDKVSKHILAVISGRSRTNAFLCSAPSMQIKTWQAFEAPWQCPPPRAAQTRAPLRCAPGGSPRRTQRSTFGAQDPLGWPAAPRPAAPIETTRTGSGYCSPNTARSPDRKRSGTRRGFHADPDAR